MVDEIYWNRFIVELDLFEFIWIVKILLVNVRDVVILCVVGVFWEYEK